MWCRRLLMVLILYFCVAKADADIIIINNPLISQKTLHQYEMQAIFMLKLSYWNNGIPITPIFINFDDPIHNLFVSSILRVSPYNFNILIGDKIQQGDSKHVIVVNSVAEAIEMVKKIAGSITYISTGGLINADEVQIIRIVD
jgi:hypothetical protein